MTGFIKPVYRLKHGRQMRRILNAWRERLKVMAKDGGNEAIPAI
jgi:hypothetical protein